MTRKHSNTDYWPDRYYNLTQSNRLAGKKLLGFQMRATKSGIRTLFVYKDSPADKAGIQSGDLIDTIDGTPSKGMTAVQFSDLLENADSHEHRIIPRTQGKQPYSVTLTKADGSTFAGGGISGSILDFMEVGAEQVAPDFRALIPDGKEIRLGDLKGRPVLIHFTATWNEQGREQTPQLAKLYEKFSKRGLEFLSVYLDKSSKDVMVYSKELGVS